MVSEINPNVLTNILKSYKALIGIIIVAFFLLISFLFIAVVYRYDKSANAPLSYRMFNFELAFNFLFVIEVLLLLLLLIIEIFTFKKNPNDSLFPIFNRTLNFTPDRYNLFLMLTIIIIGILSFFMILYLGGVLSSDPTKNNIMVVVNFLIIALFIGIAIKIYKYYADKDEQTLNAMSLPKEIRDAIRFRTKYTLIFAGFALFMLMLYFFNPFGIMTNYLGPIMFFSLFIGLFLIITITMYENYLGNPTKNNPLTDDSVISPFLKKLLYILVVLGVLFGIIYAALHMFGVFDFDATSPKSWISVMLNIIVLSVVLGIAYRMLNVAEILEKNPYLRLFVNILFYIPCLILYIFYYTFGFLSKFKGSESFKDFTVTPAKPFEIMMLVLSLLLLGGYLSWVLIGKKYFRTNYLKQGGRLLVNEPVPTDKLTNVTSYQSLSGGEIFDYQYALSFWFYLDAFPPSTNSSYNKVVSLLSYGENPAIKYSSEKNTLYISVKQTEQTDEDATDANANANANAMDADITQEKIAEYKSSEDKIKNNIEKVKLMSFGEETDSDGNRLIYAHPDVQLQKWNHVLLNYNGGTLDVFYNGKLVKSAIQVVPYIKNDMLTIGTENGVSGNIANLSYFDKPLDIKTIDTLYTELKGKNVPSIPEVHEKIVPIDTKK